ncbi:MAG: hypothetical protein ACI8VC_001434 [Candidatus Endobugula sp.]|jgi:hypothetical protein
MSFDLAIFSNFEGVTGSEVKKVYSDLSIKWKSTKEFKRFSEKIFAKYPPLENLSDEDIDLSPWASCDLCDGYMVLGFVSDKEKSDEGFNYVLEQANKEKLIILDPQGGDAFVGEENLKD